MFGRGIINTSITSRIVKSCAEREYHIFRRPGSLTSNETVFQAGWAPGIHPSKMPLGLPRTPAHPPTKMFTAGFMRKHYGVLPIVVIMGVVTLGVTAFSIFSAVSKPEVVFTRNQKKDWERVDLRNPKNKKLIKIHENYKPLEELAWLLEEMDKAEKERGVGGTDECMAPCSSYYTSPDDSPPPPPPANIPPTTGATPPPSAPSQSASGSPHICDGKCDHKGCDKDCDHSRCR